ncbi:glycosyltransferase family 4 protein [Microlunatus ginsengisoli]|uniref:Glycosyltransferase n=1 Tax=Microlunatus ginsengisoli TaxID=363863 RepID=A0ABP6ZGY6_9ACTN
MRPSRADAAPAAAVADGSAPIRIFTEARLYREPAGGFVTLDRSSADGAWRPYRDRWADAQLVARVGDVRPGDDDALSVGPIEVRPLPYYTGPRQLLAQLPRLVTAVIRTTSDISLCMFRLPGPIGFIGSLWCRLRGRRYAVEVVGDPVDVLRSGVAGSAGVRLAAACGVVMRWAVGGAATAHYVTEQTLQRHYPASRATSTHVFSNVDLHEDDFTAAPRSERPAIRRLIAVGTHDQLYKGHDDLIRAVGLLRADYPELRLRLVGDGRHSALLRSLAARTGVEDRVEFVGRVDSRTRLRELLDTSDLFCMPSRTEGLPRALIEAMARGVPSIGTTVGGIPELLPAELLVPPDDPVRLATLITRLADDPRLAAAASQIAWQTAQRFRPEEMARRRSAWYAALAELTSRGKVPVEANRGDS